MGLTRKRCTKCKRYKDRDKFGADSSRKDGKYLHCKACCKKYREVPENKERMRQYLVNYRLNY